MNFTADSAVKELPIRNVFQQNLSKCFHKVCVHECKLPFFVICGRFAFSFRSLDLKRILNLSSHETVMYGRRRIECSKSTNRGINLCNFCITYLLWSINDINNHLLPACSIENITWINFWNCKNYSYWNKLTYN